MVIRILSLLLLATLLPLAAPTAYGGWLDLFARKKGVAPVTDPLYLEECGACHFAYPPGLLPSRSWQALLASAALEDHFGDNAELDESDRKAIEAVLIDNSADHSHYKRSVQIRRGTDKADTPLRITDTALIRRKHRELTDSQVKDNPKVGSLSNCDKCHSQAGSGSFDNDQVVIPGENRQINWIPFK